MDCDKDKIARGVMSKSYLPQCTADAPDGMNGV